MNLAEILNKYDDTNILIEGHTDATGSEDYNLTLSRNRAQSVANQLEGVGVASPRFTIMGYGEAQPVADNDTYRGPAGQPAGRNRHHGQRQAEGCGRRRRPAADPGVLLMAVDPAPGRGYNPVHSTFNRPGEPLAPREALAARPQGAG